MSEEHTPGPWRLCALGIISDDAMTMTIADCCPRASYFDGEKHANAAFIVRAVNSHDALVAAIEGLLLHFHHPRAADYLTNEAYNDAVCRVCDARIALAHAKEKGL